MDGLESDLRAAFARGLEQLTIRVSRYGKDGPEAYQAIAKYRDAPGGPWSVGVRGNAVAAARAALEPIKKTTGPEDIFG